MHGIFGTIILLLDLWAIWALVQSSAPTDRKILWTAVIILLPILGLVAWALFGRKGN